MSPRQVGLVLIVVGIVMTCSALSLLALAETYLKV